MNERVKSPELDLNEETSAASAMDHKDRSRVVVPERLTS